MGRGGFDMNIDWDFCNRIIEDVKCGKKAGLRVIVNNISITDDVWEVYIYDELVLKFINGIEQKISYADKTDKNGWMEKILEIADSGQFIDEYDG